MSRLSPSTAIFGLLLALSGGAALAEPKASAATDPATAAAAAVRVGDGLAALVLAEGLPTTDAARPILLARARLALDEPALALESLDFIDKTIETDLGSVLPWVRLEARMVAHDAPELALADAEWLRAADDLPDSAQAVARLWSAALAPAAAGPTRARAILSDLSTSRAHGTLQPRALAALAADDPAAARTLCIAYPTDPEAPRPDAMVPPLSDDERHARADALYAARAYAEQLQADAALIASASASARLKQAAHLRASTALLRLFERYPEALAHAEAAAKGPDAGLRRMAHFRRSLVLGRQSAWEPARAATDDFLAAGATGSLAREAQYQKGRLLHQAGRFAEAAPIIAEFAAAQPKADRNTWRWFVGWAWYRAGRHAEARAIFAELMDDTNLLVGPKVRYWTARSLAESGDVPGALAALDDLSRLAPLGYYGALGQRLAHRLDATRPLRPTRPEGAPLAVPTADLAGLVSATPAAKRSAMDAAVLRLRVGLPELAEPWAQRALASKPSDFVQETLDIALEHFGARWSAVPMRDRILAWRVVAADADPSHLSAGLPPAWPELTARVEALHGVSRWWIMGHLLQESRYQVRARSHAGALGPMQILPRTGRRIAAEVGFPTGDFLDEALYDAGVALRHGGWYLAALRDEFQGQVLWAMAAYNGGPRRMADHFERTAGLPLDVVAEELGAHESRNYLRKVADHAIRYAALYGTQAEYEALVDSLVGYEAAPTPLGVVDF